MSESRRSVGMPVVAEENLNHVRGRVRADALIDLLVKNILAPKDLFPRLSFERWKGVDSVALMKAKLMTDADSISSVP